MLWSLVKILVFVAIVAALAFGANLLMETGPGVQLVIGDIEFNLGPLQAVLVALVAIAALWLVLKLAGLIVAFLRFSFLLESPRYYIARGEYKEASQSASILLNESITVTAQSDPPRSDLPYSALFSPQYRRNTILASVPWFLQDIATYGIGI